jgi:hypothetical protein
MELSKLFALLKPIEEVNNPNVEDFFDKVRFLNFRIVSTVPHINQGGCGIYAAFISKALEEQDIPYQIGYLTRDHDGPDAILENYELVKNNEYGYVSATHICVEVGDFLIDANGISRKEEFLKEWDRYEYYSVPISWRELELAIAQTSQWNPWFDRGNVPKIKEEFKNTFSFEYSPLERSKV